MSNVVIFENAAEQECKEDQVFEKFVGGRCCCCRLASV